MEVTREIAATQAAVAAARRAGQRIGFVPTMGALHRGHLSLVQTARHDATYVVASIFVNPTQFGPGEDFNRYPRDEAGDLRACEEAGADLVFVPTAGEMYPPGGGLTTVHVTRVTDTLCGPCRPGHFDGVATIVAKLLNVVQPDRAYFGQKDAQQLAVIRQMVRDLDWPVEIIGCPTVRDPDGLALSSRNACLSADERQRAAALHRALEAAQERILAGERDVQAVTAAMRRVLDEARPEQIDYAAIVEPNTMQLVTRIEGPVLAAVAVRIGSTRLIDNVLVDPARQGA